MIHALVPTGKGWLTDEQAYAWKRWCVRTKDGKELGSVMAGQLATHRDSPLANLVVNEALQVCQETTHWRQSNAGLLGVPFATWHVDFELNRAMGQLAATATRTGEGAPTPTSVGLPPTSVGVPSTGAVAAAGVAAAAVPPLVASSAWPSTVWGEDGRETLAHWQVRQRRHQARLRLLLNHRLVGCPDTLVQWRSQHERPDVWQQALQQAATTVPRLWRPAKEQARVLEQCRHQAVVLVQGGPGTGKSELASHLVRHPVLWAPSALADDGRLRRAPRLLVDSGNVLLLGPTHKLIEAQATRLGVRAWTFDYWLELCYWDQKKRQEGTGEPSNSVMASLAAVDVVVLDEVSMMTHDHSALLELLQRHLPRLRLLLLLGDVYQLPPIGKGQPLRTLLQSRPPWLAVCELTRNHRSQGGLATWLVHMREFLQSNACAIPPVVQQFVRQVWRHTHQVARRDGPPIAPSDRAPAPIHPVQFVESGDMGTVRLLVAKALNRIQCQGLAYRNATCDYMNSQVCRQLGLHCLEGHQLVCLLPGLRLKVLQTVRHGKGQWAKNQLLLVRQLRTRRQETSEWSSVASSRSVRRGSALEAELQSVDQPGQVHWTPIAVAALSRSFRVGFVVTVHSMQGSEVDDIVLLMDTFPIRLLYTAISRARRSVTLVSHGHFVGHHSQVCIGHTSMATGKGLTHTLLTLVASRPQPTALQGLQYRLEQPGHSRGAHRKRNR